MTNTKDTIAIDMAESNTIIGLMRVTANATGIRDIPLLMLSLQATLARSDNMSRGKERLMQRSFIYNPSVGCLFLLFRYSVFAPLWVLTLM